MRLAVALMLSVPLAAAAPVTVYDDSFGPADCPTPGDYHHAQTSVTVEQDDSYVRAGGSSWCYRDADNGRVSINSVFADVGTSAGWAHAAWSGSPSGGCYTFVAAATVSAVGPCPFAPPDPGWGHLLP